MVPDRNLLEVTEANVRAASARYIALFLAEWIQAAGLPALSTRWNAVYKATSAKIFEQRSLLNGFHTVHRGDVPILITAFK